MVDLCEKVQGSESEDMNSKTADRVSSEESLQVKTCADCGTTKTPLWRGGPAGPKSLCNACGIRSRKKRRALLGLNKEDKKAKKTTCTTMTSPVVAVAATAAAANKSHSNGTSNSGSKLGDSVKRKLWALGREVVLQRPRSASTGMGKQRKKLGEEEQAAVLLMALSCGSVYA